MNCVGGNDNFDEDDEVDDDSSVVLLLSAVLFNPNKTGLCEGSFF